MLTWLFATCTLAQTLSLASDPAALAKAALGSEPGSASVAVWRDGRIDAATVRNPAAQPVAAPTVPPVEDLAPLYEIGSISKLFTGLLLAQAVEQGDLQLSDTLGTVLRGQVEFSSPDVAAITLQQLVTHGSCLPRQFGNLRGGEAIAAQITKATRAEMWAALAAQKMAKAGPCAALYSNYGMSVLAEALSVRYGKPWSDLVRERITQPLAMADTQVVLGDKAPRFVAAYAGRATTGPWDMQAFVGAGGLRSSVQDLVRFGRALLQGRDGLLGAPAERFFTPLAAFDGGQIGYAVFIDGPPERRTYSHDGLTGGYRALLRMHGDTGEVMAALVSNRFAPLPQLAVDLSQSRYPVESEAVPVPASKLADYAGSFRVSPERIVHVAVDAEALVVRSPQNVFRAYVPVGPDRFTRPAGGARISFARAADGQINTLTLEQGGRVFRAVRTDAPVIQQPVLGPGVAAMYVGKYLAPRFLRTPVEFNVRETSGQLMIRSP
ncbi:MAG: serine hydrolase domain-containing protein, partial [Burkholderiaceae bacterium]